MTIDITTFSREFTAIVNALLRDEKGRVDGGYLLVDKETVTAMLGKHAYATVKEKLRVWRGLRWIDADEGHFTRNVVTNDKRIRMLKIDLEIHKELHRLQTQATNEENRNTTPTKKLKNKSKKSNVIKPKTGGVI